MSLSFTVVTTPADRRRGRAARRTHRQGRRARARRRRGRRRARRRPRRLPRRGRLRGEARRDAGGADRRPAQGEGRDPRGHRRSGELTVDGVRRAAAAVGAAREQGRVGRHHPGHRRHRARRRRRRAGRRRGSRARRATSTSSTRATPSPTKLKKVTIDRGRRRARCAPRSSGARRSATRSRWARDMVNTPSKEKSPADMVAAARKLLRGRGVTVQVLDVKQLRGATPRWRARRRPGFGAAAPVPQDDVRAVGRARQGARAGGQGRGVRLRWPVAQDRRRHGDDEDRHVGRRGGDRGDVDARRPRREDARHRLRAAGGEHAERQRHPSRRRAEDPQRQDGRGAQHRRRGPPDPRRRALAGVGGQAGRGHRPRHAHRRVHGRARRQDRRAHGQRRRVGRRRCATPPTAPASRCGRCRCRPSTASSSSRRSPT